MSTILIIEDDRTVLENIVEALEMNGYISIAANSGSVGIAMARQHTPKLILCDLMMPDLDGFDVFRELHSHHETNAIPFVIMSAKADYETISQAKALGVSAHLPKPFTIPELLSVIDKHLNA